MKREDLIRMLEAKAASSDTNARDVNACMVAVLDYYGSLHVESCNLPLVPSGSFVGMSVTADATGEGHMVKGYGLTLLEAMLDMLMEASPFRERGDKPLCGLCGLEPHGAPPDGDEAKCPGDDACCAGCSSASTEHPCLAHGCTSWCRQHYEASFIGAEFLAHVRKELVQ